jgi:8-oxo-dGTP pyrophosphatase MutT (NUDIX family)
MTHQIKYKKKYISCTNCGEPGHVLKTCKQPITSFGVIVYKEQDEFCVGDTNPVLSKLIKDIPDNDSKVKLLLIQRKDTIGYTDFLRGKYNKENIGLLFQEMTKHEQYSLLTCTFDELWDKLWINHNSKTYKNEYNNAKYKFNSTDLQGYIQEYPSVYDNSEFSIPKGRKNVQEGNVQCAEREFYEETGYNASDYHPINIKNYIVEDFIGTDNVRYKHYYYITKVYPCKIRNPTIHNTLQMEEVKDIGWFTIPQALSLMRPYDTAKKQILLTFMEHIKSE